MKRAVQRCWVILGDPDPNDAMTCPRCGFDSLLTFPVSLLLTDGVSDLGSCVACPRCSADETERPSS